MSQSEYEVLKMIQIFAYEVEQSENIFSFFFWPRLHCFKAKSSIGRSFGAIAKPVPFDDFIVATVEVWNRMNHPGQKAALRGGINKILENEKTSVSNLSKKEKKVLNDLKSDIYLISSNRTKN